MKGTCHIVEIDLETGKVSRDQFGPETVEKYVGGFGLGCKLFAEMHDPEAGPFSPENPVIIGAGVLVGSYLPSAGKIFALTKCPLPEEELARVFTPAPYYGSFNLGRMTKFLEDRGAIMQSLGLCDGYNIFGFFPAEVLTKLYYAFTGIEKDTGEMRRAGERISNLYKVLNVKEGFTRRDDRCPEVWFTPIETPDGEAAMTDYYGERKISPEDVEHLLDDYYDERGWDVAEGVPTPETLAALGLGDGA